MSWPQALAVGTTVAVILLAGASHPAPATAQPATPPAGQDGPRLEAPARRGGTGNALEEVAEWPAGGDAPGQDPDVSTGPTAEPASSENSAAGQQAGPARPPASNGGAGGLVPPSSGGRWPLDRYEIYYSEGWITSIFRNLVGSLTALVFALATWAVGVGVWLVEQSYSFGVGAMLVEPAGRLAQAMETRLVGPLRLADMALFAAVVWGGWQALRGRLARGAGEVALSLLVLAVAGLVLARPVAIFEGGVRLAAGLSAAVLDLAAESPPAGSPGQGPAPARPGVASRWEVQAAHLEPLTGGLRQAFIEVPYDLLNWGQVLTGRCATRREGILAEGPHGTEDRPRDLLRQVPGCAQFAEWNATPTLTRLLGAVLTLLTAGLVILVLILVAATVVVAQLVGVGLIGILPVAVVGGLLPGGGRQLLWRWAGAGLGTVAVVVGMAGVLTVLIVGAGALAAGREGTLLGRFALLALLAATGLVLRRRILAAARGLGSHLAGRLEGARIGGSGRGGLMGPPAAGGVTGFGVGGLAGQAGADLKALRHNRVTDSRPAQAVAARLRHRRAGPGSPKIDGQQPAALGQALTAARRGQPRAQAVGDLARAAARVADAPRTAPRAAARARVALTSKRQQAAEGARARIQDVGRKGRQWATNAGRYQKEWVDGLLHPVRTYRQELHRLSAAGREKQRQPPPPALRVSYTGRPPQDSPAGSPPEPLARAAYEPHPAGGQARPPKGTAEGNPPSGERGAGAPGRPEEQAGEPDLGQALARQRAHRSPPPKQNGDR